MKILLILLCSTMAGISQNVAVLLARDDASAPAGYPTNWPVRVQPIGSLTNLPPQFPPPWRFATKAQVDKWMSDHAAEMEAYQAEQEAAATQPKRDRETAIRQAVADLKTIRDSSGTLTAAQLSNAVRALAKALVALIEELRP
jgi:hypothetical protein